MAVAIITDKGGYKEIAGLSTDDKPLDCATGSIFMEVDTGKTYLYNSDAQTWVEYNP